MKYLFLALFIITSVIHLVDSWNNDRIKRARTKPFLLVFLTLFYVFATPEIDYFLLGALITSWLGDVLLIPRGDKWFIVGGISFMLAHFLFIISYAGNIDLGKANWYIVVPMAVIYFGISFWILHILKPSTPKKMVLPMNFYLLCNSAMNLCALLQLMTYRNLGSLLALLGAVLFFVSDCCLFVLRYHSRQGLIFKNHFTVMITYLLGEFLITAGMLSLSGWHLFI